MNYTTKKHYKQINFEERVKIEYFLNECLESISKIAKRLKRAKSTIKREIERNLFKGKYIAQKANDIYLKRFITKHKLPIENYPEFSKLFLKYF
ncbi:helix-turn-helix domain-containing protein, partial [Mycoplasma marinum]